MHFSCAMLVCCETLTSLFQKATVQTRSIGSTGARGVPGSLPKPHSQPSPVPFSGDALEKERGTPGSSWHRDVCVQQQHFSVLTGASSPLPQEESQFPTEAFPPPPLFFLVYGEDAVQNDPEYWGLWNLAVPVFSS